MSALPTEMNALVADATATSAAAAFAALRVTRRAVPSLSKGRVLVRVEAAPCNPADILYLEGRYGIDRPLPATPGFEGAGVVVASGGGLLAGFMMGKRVACGGHACSGMWAEYVVVAADQCVPLRRELSIEQGATALANPITALALVALMKKGGHRAYVQNGAAGALGKMIARVALDSGVIGVHVVRRAEQAESLRALGMQHVVVSTSSDARAQLAERVRAVGATIALDAVAGSATGELVDVLPVGGEVVVYGALSGERCGAIEPMALAFGHKRVRGFEIAAHLRSIGVVRSFRLASEAQRRVAAGVVTTTIAARLSLPEAPAGLVRYAQAMSDGKVLITPHAPVLST